MSRVTWVILAAVLAAAGPAVAGPLYAVSGSGGAASTLYEIDPATGGVVQTVGATGFSHVTGLRFDPTTGILYGHSNTGGGSLITIDLLTGLGTLVGLTGLQVPDMAFDAAGQLFAWGEPGFDDLFAIDKSTGASALVGESGIGTAAFGLAFDDTGTLYGKSGSTLYTIDPSTGVATFDKSLSAGLQNALAFDPATNAAYGVGRSGGTSFLNLIDISTGTVTLVGNIGVGNISALAFAPEPVASTVPEPGSMALLGMGGVGLVGGWLRRRKAAVVA